MMCSYYDEHTLERAKSVEDKELNELLQEVRKIDESYYLQENKKVVKRGIFKKPIEKTSYTVLKKLRGDECQIINFCQDTEWSINSSVSKSYIHTLFCGFLNGSKSTLRNKI